MGTYALWNKTVRYYGHSDMKHVLHTTSFNSTDDIIFICLWSSKGKNTLVQFLVELLFFKHRIFHYYLLCRFHPLPPIPISQLIHKKTKIGEQNVQYVLRKPSKIPIMYVTPSPSIIFYCLSQSVRGEYAPKVTKDPPLQFLESFY